MNDCKNDKLAKRNYNETVHLNYSAGIDCVQRSIRFVSLHFVCLKVAQA